MVHGQTLTGREKAILDLYYAQAANDLIPGDWLQDGTVGLPKLDAASSNAVVFVGIYSDDILYVISQTNLYDAVAAWTQTYSNDVTSVLGRTNTWIYSTNAIATIGDAASDYTIAVNSSNVYFCVTDDYFGPGTNWMRMILQTF